MNRRSRTPTSEAEIILTNLEDIYARLVVVRNGEKKTPKELRLEDALLHETRLFKELIATGAPTGDELVEQHRAFYPANDDNVSHFDEMHALVIALAYSIQALRFDAAGQRDLAWTYVIDSHTWLARSLNLKPGRIEKINHRKAVSHKRQLAAKLKNQRYESHTVFIIDTYKSGVWRNAYDAAGDIEPMLEAYIKKNGLWTMSADNAFKWIYETLRDYLLQNTGLQSGND